MNTLRVPVDPWNPDPAVLREAAAVLRRGGLVAFPTETVYGLGANALNADAVRGIYRAKGRPSDNPLILHLACREEAERLARPTPRARSLMSAFWPGPLTLVLPARPVVPAETRGGLDTAALRMPDHPVAAALIEAAGFPLAAPSANLSGRPSPTDADSVWEDLGGRADMILDAGPVSVGIESTVLDMTTEPPLLLRPGGLSREVLEDFLGVGLGCPEVPSARSPGTRYRHYAPFVPVWIWEGGPLPEGADPGRCGFMGLTSPSAPFARSLRFDSPENYARGLFAGFRAMESAGVLGIVVQWPPASGVGLGLRDRIRRAARTGAEDDSAASASLGL